MRVVALTTDGRHVFVNLEFETCRLGDKSRIAAFLEPDRSRYLSYQLSVRKHLRGISVRDNRLTVVSPKERELEISHSSSGLILRDIGKAAALGERLRSFEATDRDDLLKATWPGGSEAWLDGRGLLHLRSSNYEIPELTLVLHDGQMAGWCSNGQLFGSAYFVGPEQATNDQSQDSLHRFVRHLS